MRVKLNKEEGFTLLEALISLAISAIVLLLLTSGIVQAGKIKDVFIDDSQNITDNENVVSGDRQIEWHLFLNQLERYLAETANPRVSQNIVLVDEWDEESKRYYEVSYVRPDTNRRVFIRRKNSGNQRMLIGIDAIHFKHQEEGWLLIETKFRNGEIYNGRIWIESWAKNERKDLQNEPI